MSRPFVNFGPARYNILQFHRQTAEVEGGNFGVFVAGSWQPEAKVSVHETLRDAEHAVQRYEEADSRRRAK